MTGPDDGFRAEVALAAEEIVSEEQLDALLVRIEEELAADLKEPEEDAERMIDGVVQWASVASYAVARFYGPASPWPSRDLAGYGKRAVEKLREIASQLSQPLAFALHSTGASSFSISVGFPWGISVGLSWP
jgi:hypothetical protein